MAAPPFPSLGPVFSAAAAPTTDDDGFGMVTRRTNDPFDRISDALRRYGRIFLWIGIGLSAVLAIKILAPVQIYYGMQDRRLRRAVRPVDELLKRIGKEAEVASEAPKEEEAAADNGVLAGMMEIAEFEQAEQTPPYVLTVNDMMLDNIGLTLKRLRRFHDGSAEKYQDNMFTVIHGIQTISEHSAEAGVPSGLAVDVAEYFKDEHRYKTWRKTLGRWTGKGKHQETSVAFLSFMRTVREGRPVVKAKPAAVSLGDTAVTAAPQQPVVPEILNEQTLPTVQKAAGQEARDLLAFIRTGTLPQKAARWQAELVRRQQQIRLRDEAQQMFSVFLKEERKALLAITKIQMLPCRTWGHVLYLLGVESTAQLDKRIDDRLITEQEIIVLEKAFLQTLAKRESLVRIYGQGPQAALMADEHVPEIRRETLALIQRLHRTEPGHLASATETLNEEETPRNGLVKKLIEQYKSKK
ncbi:MAG TPA: hypothetical protein VLI39_00145 [Sedimentisphaerales bacterium]|nr:hypothetical protein [Sedimentisphaerales bacterium]